MVMSMEPLMDVILGSRKRYHESKTMQRGGSREERISLPKPCVAGSNPAGGTLSPQVIALSGPADSSLLSSAIHPAPAGSERDRDLAPHLPRGQLAHGLLRLLQRVGAVD